jgi:flavodoxin
MKTLIIYASTHHGNTEGVAQEIGSVLNAKTVKFFEVSREDIEAADLIGLGSGIYFTNFHKGLLDLVKNLPEIKGKKVFLFSTSGMKGNNIFNRSHDKFKKALKDKDAEVVGEFNCPGYDTYSILKFIGGINRGRPDQKDVDRARRFAQSLKEYN